MTTDDDIVYINAVLSGDVNAFENIISKYKKHVFAVISKRVPFQEIESVAQDVFVRSFRSLEKYKPKKPFKHWLSTIAMRASCDYWRKNSKEINLRAVCGGDSHTDAFELLLDLHSFSDAKEKEYKSELVEIMEISLGKLDAEDRTLIDLVYMEGWKLKDVASVLEWGIAKTKVRAMRVRRKLKLILSELLDESREEKVVL